MEMRTGRIALDKIYKRRDRYEIPDWQREQVWNADKQRLLINSILRGWKLPKFYFQKTGEDPDTYEVVDGQQRLTAIWEFIDGDIRLDEQAAAVFGGAAYRELSDKYSDQFDDFEIEYDLIVDSSEDDIKEFFQRLQAGLPLTSSEKLNSVHSQLRDFCSTLAKHTFFEQSTRVTSRRLAYFDICAKVVTVEIEGFDAGLRFDDVKQVFLANKSFSETSAVAERCKSTLDFLLEAFPEPSLALRQRSTVQSVINLVAHLKRAGLSESQAPLVKDFVETFSAELLRQVELGHSATDVDYLAFQRTVNANAKLSAEIRHNILLRKLFAAHPSIFSAMVKSKELDSSITSAVKHDSDEIRELIKIVNESYSAKHGCDLFKPTNRTVEAQTSLDLRLSSFVDYKSWIGHLYFLFRESVGSRLDGGFPQSFRDVNSLRTALQHDVDHGKGASSKRKKLAATFATYSGNENPETLPPEQFCLVQANLLSAIVTDMRKLSQALNQ